MMPDERVASQAMRRLMAVLAVAVVLVGCGGGDDDASPPTTAPPAATEPAVETATITGDIGNPSMPCSVAGATGSWARGDRVIITNGEGVELAVGEITGPVGDRTDGCFLGFEVEGVPAGEPGYRVIVKDEAPVDYTWSQLLDGPSLRR